MGTEKRTLKHLNSDFRRCKKYFPSVWCFLCFFSGSFPKGVNGGGREQHAVVFRSSFSPCRSPKSTFSLSTHTLPPTRGGAQEEKPLRTHVLSAVDFCSNRLCVPRVAESRSTIDPRALSPHPAVSPTCTQTHTHKSKTSVNSSDDLLREREISQNCLVHSVLLLINVVDE